MKWTMRELLRKTRAARGYICVVTAAVLWGFMGLFNRGMIAGGISPLTVVLLRNAGSMAVLLPGVRVLRPSAVKVPSGTVKYFIGTGIFGVLLFSVCFFRSQQYCTMAVASTLEYTAPAIVVVLSALLWREPITKKKVLCLLMVLGGCAISAGLLGQGNHATTRGLLLALASGFFYALYTVFGRYALEAGAEPLTVILWTFVFSGFGSLVFWNTEELTNVVNDPAIIWLAVGMVFVSTVVPYLLYTSALQTVEAGTASILATMELPSATVVGFLAFDERPTTETYMGILLIVGGIVLLNYKRVPEKKP